MFLLFQLRRLDIWPAGDLGIRRGFGLAWQIPLPTPRQRDLLGEPYHPYRSVVLLAGSRTLRGRGPERAYAIMGAVQVSWRQLRLPCTRPVPV